MWFSSFCFPEWRKPNSELETSFTRWRHRHRTQPPYQEEKPMDAQSIRNLEPALDEYFARFTHCFPNPEPQALCCSYLRGLLSGNERKNVERIALEARLPRWRKGVSGEKVSGTNGTVGQTSLVKLRD
jgi:hypothetical protein